MSVTRAYANLWQQLLKDACWEALHGLGFASPWHVIVSVVVAGLALGVFSRYASSDQSVFDQAEWLLASARATTVVGVALFIVGGVKAISQRVLRAERARDETLELLQPRIELLHDTECGSCQWDREQ